MNRLQPLLFLFSVILISGCSEIILPDNINHVGLVEETGEGLLSLDESIGCIGNLSIDTYDGMPVNSKTDYVDCSVKLEGGIYFGSYSGSARIRGRGNSTWAWYPKKPFRLKLDEKKSIMGLAPNKDWVLMADYRDPTHMMNLVAFAMGHYLGMPFTNHYKYVRLTLNGENLGLYMITEHIEQGKSRVDIDKETGYLFNMDYDDGPSRSPASGDNFYSQVYNTEVGMKWPDKPTVSQVEKAKEDFAIMEKAVLSHKLADIVKYLDLQSAVNVLLVHEITQNIDFCNSVSFHSVPIHKVDDKSPWTWGPLWDFDSGFSLDVNNHKKQGFFVEYKKLIIGSDPYVGTDAYCGRLPRILGDLFFVPEFVNLLKETWNNNKVGMLEYVLSEIDNAYPVITDAAHEDYTIWGISSYLDFDEQIRLLKKWLVDRFDYLDSVIRRYPVRGIQSTDSP